jgi:hypothetical protein
MSLSIGLVKKKILLALAGALLLIGLQGLRGFPARTGLAGLARTVATAAAAAGPGPQQAPGHVHPGQNQYGDYYDLFEHGHSL